MKAEYIFNLYMMAPPRKEPIDVTQNDNLMVELVAKLKNRNGTAFLPPEGAVANFIAVKPDGTGIVLRSDDPEDPKVTLADDEVRVSLPREALAVTGWIACKIAIQDNDAIASSQEFGLMCNRDLLPEDFTESEAYQSIIYYLEHLGEREAEFDDMKEQFYQAINGLTEDDEVINARIDGPYATTFDTLKLRLDHMSGLLKGNTSEVENTKLKVIRLEQEVKRYKELYEQSNPTQSPRVTSTGYGVISLPPNAANGQVSVILKGNTWTNRAGIGDTSPQTIENLDSAKTYLLIKTDGGTVNVDAVDTAVPAKITGKTSTVLTWASGKIALYELSTAEAALTEAQLGARYHYVSGTKSTVSAIRLKSVGKNLSELSYIDNNKRTILGKKLDNFWLLSNGMWYRENNAYHRSLFTGQGGTSSNRDINLLPKLTPNTTYFFDAVTEGNTLNVALFNPDGTISGTPKILPTSLTTGNNDIYLDIRISSQASIYFKDLIISKINTPYEPYTESNAYVVAKDSEGKIAELRSLPNGTKDEINVTDRKLIKRIGEKSNIANGMVIDFADMAEGGTYYAWNDDGETEAGVKGDTLGIDATTLIYQLAEPEIIPIQVSGSLTSHPNGTVFIEPFVADAGIYTDKMEVLYSDLPIKALEMLSKIDFMTGLETELDVSDAVIAEDKLSFTHPDLEAGDIVFFVYEYDRESTVGETEIEYYDSRYVIKDSVTGKFYKWHIAVEEGVPSIELVEV